MNKGRCILVQIQIQLILFWCSESKKHSNLRKHANGTWDSGSDSAQLLSSKPISTADMRYAMCDMRSCIIRCNYTRMLWLEDSITIKLSLNLLDTPGQSWRTWLSRTNHTYYTTTTKNLDRINPSVPALRLWYISKCEEQEERSGPSEDEECVVAKSGIDVWERKCDEPRRRALQQHQQH